ncbi:MAG: DUF7673 family protein [Inquilinus sp.]|uniref:DUF7673 family protein n=1 Tax=Inquilinus sp. TaxID=1932117 RepID=UPI003F37A550
MTQRHRVFDGAAIAAIDRLIAIAADDTTQGGTVTNFLLAWWDRGNFRLGDLQAVDSDVAEDLATVFSLVARNHCTPEALGYKTEFERLAADRQRRSPHYGEMPRGQSDRIIVLPVGGARRARRGVVEFGECRPSRNQHSE